MLRPGVDQDPKKIDFKKLSFYYLTLVKLGIKILDNQNSLGQY